MVFARFKRIILIAAVFAALAAALFACVQGEQGRADLPAAPAYPGDDGIAEPAAGTLITISYEAENSKAGEIKGTKQQKIRYGETAATEVRAVPALGWKFVQWSDGWADPVRSGDSFKSDTTVTAFFTKDKLTMPTMSINTDNRGIGDSYVRAEIIISYVKPDVTQKYDAQIHVRGANSRGYPKKSYKIRLDNRYDIIDLTGGGRGNRHYVLLAMWNDYTLMRNPMGFDLMSRLDGIPYSPKYEYVEVYLNDVYAGVYLLVEQIRVDEDRVNINDGNTGDTNSFLVASAPGRELQLTYLPDYDGGYYGVSDGGTFGKMRVRSRVHNQQQLKFIRDTLNRAWNSIPSKAAAERRFDIPSLVDVYIAAEIMKGYDIAWNNHFWMHYDETSDKVYFTVLWDLKFGGGNHSGHNNFWADSAGLGMIAAQGQGAQQNRWFIELMKQTWFRALVQERFAEIDDVLDSIAPFLRATYDLHENSFKRNFERWPSGNIGTNSNFTPRPIVALKNCGENADYLINWMEKRITWLRSYLGSMRFINHAGTTNPGG